MGENRRLSPSVVVVCNAAGGQAAGRPGGRHFTAGQSCYAPLGRHLVLFAMQTKRVKQIQGQTISKTHCTEEERTDADAYCQKHRWTVR